MSEAPATNNPKDPNPRQQVKKTVSFSKLKEYLPYFSGLIILLGLLRQMIYYSYYHVEIQNYIGVSELLLAWMDEAWLFVFFVFNTTMLFIFFSNQKYPKGKYATVKLKNMENRMIKISSIATFLLTIILCFFSLYYFAAGIITFFFLPFYSLAKRILKFYPVSLKAFQFIYFSIGVFVTFTLLTAGSIHGVNKGAYTGTKIYTKDSTYVSDSIHFYIGKTTNYYFIYNKDKKSTLVLPEREVSKFELHGEIPILK